MTLQELLDLCAGSSAADWNSVTAWGARSGPSYLDRFMAVETRRREDDKDLTYELRHEEHSMRAAFKSNVAIGIAWGMYVDPTLDISAAPRRFDEDWATNFPDPDATWHFVDFFYCGALVNRESYVNVDSRCNLPLPKKEFDGEGLDTKITALTITPWQRDFFRVLNALETSVDYDSYLHRAGFKVGP